MHALAPFAKDHFPLCSACCFPGVLMVARFDVQECRDGRTIFVLGLHVVERQLPPFLIGCLNTARDSAASERFTAIRLRR
jgi:hypothetical protein